MHNALPASNRLPGSGPASVHGNVRAEIARHRVSQTDVATALGITQSAISRRLSGKVDFSATELSTLAAFLDIPVSTFFGEPSRASA